MGCGMSVMFDTDSILFASFLLEPKHHLLVLLARLLLLPQHQELLLLQPLRVTEIEADERFISKHDPK